jgi:hypothetical protein
MRRATVDLSGRAVRKSDRRSGKIHLHPGGKVFPAPVPVVRAQRVDCAGTRPFRDGRYQISRSTLLAAACDPAVRDEFDRLLRGRQK